MSSTECYFGVFFAVLFSLRSDCFAIKSGLDFQPSLTGYFGCKFNGELCSPQEVCIDDDLFGNCQPKTLTSYDLHRYDLDLATLERLEQNLRQLISRKYSWKSLYTQCIIAGTLFAFRDALDFNPSKCRRILDENTEERITDQVLKLIENYVDEFGDDTPPAGYDNGRQGAPRDEFVTVHKYYKPKKSDFTFSPPTSSDWGASSRGGGDNSESQDYVKFLQSLSPEELQFVESYLTSKDEDKSRDLIETREEPTVEEKAKVPDESWGEKFDYLPNQDGRSEEELSPSDMELLLRLLNADIGVDSLRDDEVERLSRYVTRLLDVTDPGQSKEATRLPTQFAGAISSRTTAQTKPTEAPTEVAPAQKKPAQKKPAHKKPAQKKQNKFSVDIMDDWPGSQDANRDPVGTIEINKTGRPSSQVLKETNPSSNWPTPNSGQLTKEHANEALLTRFAAEKKAVVSKQEKNKDEDVETQAPELKFSLVENDYTYLTFSSSLAIKAARSVVIGFESILRLEQGTFHNPRLENDTVVFQVIPNSKDLNASEVAALAYFHQDELAKLSGSSLAAAGIGNVHRLQVDPKDSSPPRYFILTFVLCGCVAAVLIIVVALYLVRRHSRTKQKLAQLASTADPKEASQDYQDLCRQRMQSKAQEKPEPLHIASRIGSSSEVAQSPRSSKSSTSSWSEEPVTTNMDISTGHVVLSYMEDHLKDRDRLDREWEGLCAYEAEPSSIDVASRTNNARKNRYTDVLPYDHSRVVLNVNTNVSSCDYVNASSITDHDPRNPAYIATQGPLPHTVADFWQMVWEQGSVVIVMLTRLTENGMAMCHRYWPEEGSDLYHIYEVHLVSEHIWCDDFLVRSFYLKNLQTNETRTVTQFHYLTWAEGGIPTSAKALLDFRRKVNKSYRGRSCPVIVHCNDGVGRTGNYILIDMVLNRMYKGAKEIDIAATLEHIRDQRTSMLQTKDQFEFSLASVAEEVHAILRALPQ